MNPETLPEPEDPRDEEALSLGEDVVDVSLDDAGGLDLQAFADAVAEATPDGAEGGTGHTVNLDEAELAQAQKEVIDDVRGLHAQLDQSLGQVKALEVREKEMLDQLHRLSKDFTNFRGRAARDTQMAVEQAERKVLLEFLPVLDNFERGLESSYPDLEAFRGGVDLIRKQFLDAVRRCGVEVVPLSVGDPFNAHTSEALTTMTVPELPDGAVAAVYEKGYMFKEQLLRPAKVVVNHNHGEAASGPSAQGALDPDAPGTLQ